MISVTVQQGDIQTDIRFPCWETELSNALTVLGVSARETPKLFISEVHFPEELAVIKGKQVNLDELNYLGRRLQGFFGDEYPRFSAAIKHTGAKTMREMINIACNIARYVLITDISDPDRVGREYLIQTEGHAAADGIIDPKYAKIGRELLQPGRGTLTEQGLFYIATEIPVTQSYNGSTFPQYLDDPNCMIIVELSYRGQTEYVNLPTESLGIHKALDRLGASRYEECDIKLNHMGRERTPFRDLCGRLLQTEGLAALNHWSERSCSSVSPENSIVFEAAFAASGADNIQDALKIAEKVDSFYFAKGIKNTAELGKWWLKNYSQFTLSPELEQFFDYKAYGEYLSQFLDIYYLETGDCVFLDGTTMDEVLGISATEKMGMEGMK